MCCTHPGPWVTRTGPCEHPVGEAALRRAVSHSFLLLVLWALQGPGGRALPQGVEKPGAWDQEPGTQRPDPVQGPPPARELDIQKSQWGGKTVPWRREFNGEGPLFVGHLLQTEECTAKKLCGAPAVGTEPRAQGLASEGLLSQEPHGAPCPASPLQAVGSLTRGRGAEIQAG